LRTGRGREEEAEGAEEAEEAEEADVGFLYSRQGRDMLRLRSASGRQS